MNVNETLRENTLNVIEQVARHHNYWVARITQLQIASNASDLQYQCELFGILEEAYDRLTDIHKKLGALKDHLGRKVLVEGFKVVDVPSQYVGDTEYTLGHRITGSFTDKEAGYDWLNEIGEGGMITPTVNSNTLSAFLRRYVEDEAKTPPDFVKVNTMEYVKIGKGKNSKRMGNVAKEVTKPKMRVSRKSTGGREGESRTFS